MKRSLSDDIISSSPAHKKQRVQQISRVAIVGTAGRKNEPLNKHLSLDLFLCMVKEAQKIITDTFGLLLGECRLLSGGAAWADHVAVRLFLENETAGLVLYLPCEFDEDRFRDTGDKDWTVNPGQVANYYHKLFQEKTGCPSRKEIARAREKGAVFDTSQRGFHQRNSAVSADATHMIAFTWSKTGRPSDGGTLDTWTKCALPSTHKIHVDLNRLRGKE